MIEENGDVDLEEDIDKVMNKGDKIITYDWLIMSFLARKCKKLSENKENKL